MQVRLRIKANTKSSFFTSLFPPFCLGDIMLYAFCCEKRCKKVLLSLIFGEENYKDLIRGVVLFDSGDGGKG